VAVIRRPVDNVLKISVSPLVQSQTIEENPPAVMGAQVIRLSRQHALQQLKCLSPADLLAAVIMNRLLTFDNEVPIEPVRWL
jgi:hypothetical protein